MLIAIVLNDDAGTDERFEREVFDGGCAGDEVAGGVDVGAGVRAEREFADVVRIAGADALVVVEFDAGFAGVGGEAGAQGNGDVVELQQSTSQSIMTGLRRRCYPDAVAEPRIFSDEEIAAGVEALGGWELRDGRLRKQYTFRTFLRAMVFVNSVAYLSEGAGHHPDITINYNKVTLRLITHSEKALTDRDFSLAREIDEKLASKLIVQPEGGE